jgi:hypothetical protein
MQNLLDPDVVNSLVAPDATYLSLNAENAELNKILPWAGTSHGPQAFLGNLAKRHEHIIKRRPARSHDADKGNLGTGPWPHSRAPVS